MSIISQDIKGGFVKVSRPGSYFSLISASGVVRVVLRLKGSDVLDSKFWVGMSINEPIQYDSILIYGDDAPVEFWAGKVSMNQARASIAGANALRAKVIYADGETLLTSSDVTRSAVRLRSDKNIWLGGAAFGGGNNWKLTAGEMLEIPIAGSVYAYKPLAVIDLSSTVKEGLQADFWPTVTGGSGGFYVSDDEQIRIFHYMTGGKLRATSDGGLNWADVLTGVVAYVYHKQSKRHFAIAKNSGTNEFYFRRSNDGFTWETLFNGQTIIEAGSAGNYSQYDEPRIVGDLMQMQWAGNWVAFNIETGEAFGGCRQSFGSLVNHSITLDSSMKSMIIIGYNGSKNVLMKTIDGGQSWYEVFSDVGGSGPISASEDGRFIAACGSDGYVSLSDDYGETFFKTSSQYAANTYLTHVYNGLFVGYKDVYKAFYVLNGEAYSEALSTVYDLSYASGVFVSDSGKMYTGKINSTTRDSSKMSLVITGDTSPAKVEVMELLS